MSTGVGTGPAEDEGKRYMTLYAYGHVTHHAANSCSYMPVTCQLFY